MNRSEKGCLLAGALLGAGGIVLLIVYDKGPLAFLVGFILLVLILMSKPWQKVTPEERKGVEDQEMAAALAKLGIPLDFGATTPQDAMTGGAAKAGIFRGFRSLEERRWDEALARLGSVVDLLTRSADAKWNKVLGVACRLRAAAHEGAGRRAEALADFERALSLAPDDAEALAGKKRLG